MTTVTGYSTRPVGYVPTELDTGMNSIEKPIPLRLHPDFHNLEFEAGTAMKSDGQFWRPLDARDTLTVNHYVTQMYHWKGYDAVSATPAHQSSIKRQPQCLGTVTDATTGAVTVLNTFEPITNMGNFYVQQIMGLNGPVPISRSPGLLLHR